MKAIRLLLSAAMLAAFFVPAIPAAAQSSETLLFEGDITSACPSCDTFDQTRPFTVPAGPVRIQFTITNNSGNFDSVTAGFGSSGCCDLTALNVGGLRSMAGIGVGIPFEQTSTLPSARVGTWPYISGNCYMSYCMTVHLKVYGQGAPATRTWTMGGKVCLRPAVYDALGDCGQAGDHEAPGAIVHIGLVLGDGSRVPFSGLDDATSSSGINCSGIGPSPDPGPTAVGGCWSTYSAVRSLDQDAQLWWNLSTPQVITSLDPAALAYLSWRESGGFQTPAASTGGTFDARDFVVDAQLARGTRLWDRTTVSVLGFVLPESGLVSVLTEAEQIAAAAWGVDAAQTTAVFARQLTLGATAGVVGGGVVAALFLNPSTTADATLRFPDTGETVTIAPRSTVRRDVGFQGVQAQTGTVLVVDTVPLQGDLVNPDPAPVAAPATVINPHPVVTVGGSPAGCGMPNLDLAVCLVRIVVPNTSLQTRLGTLTNEALEHEPFASVGAGAGWVGQLWGFFTDDTLTLCVPMLEDDLAAQGIALTRPCVTITRAWTVFGWQPLEIAYGISTVVIAWLWISFIRTKWESIVGGGQ